MSKDCQECRKEGRVCGRSDIWVRLFVRISFATMHSHVKATVAYEPHQVINYDA